MERAPAPGKLALGEKRSTEWIFCAVFSVLRSIAGKEKKSKWVGA